MIFGYSYTYSNRGYGLATKMKTKFNLIDLVLVMPAVAALLYGIFSFAL
jgi:hypothetical protein